MIATQTVVLNEVYRDENGNLKEHLVQKEISVSIGKGFLPIVIRGFGINEARFRNMEEVYQTFCHPMSTFRLDYDGCSLILRCLVELGYIEKRIY